MALIQCCVCQQEVPDRADLCPYCGAEPVKVRGLWTIWVFAAVGLVLATLGGAVWMAVRNASGAEVLPASQLFMSAACWGALGGGVVGALFWAFFPYKSGPRTPEPAEETGE